MMMTTKTTSSTMDLIRSVARISAVLSPYEGGISEGVEQEEGRGERKIEDAAVINRTPCCFWCCSSPCSCENRHVATNCGGEQEQDYQQLVVPEQIVSSQAQQEQPKATTASVKKHPRKKRSPPTSLPPRDASLTNTILTVKRRKSEATSFKRKEKEEQNLDSWRSGAGNDTIDEDDDDVPIAALVARTRKQLSTPKNSRASRKRSDGAADHDAADDTWDCQYRRLVMARRNKPRLPPTEAKARLKTLEPWMRQQRFRIIRNEITERQKKLLEKIHFNLRPSWDDRYQQLLAFQQASKNRQAPRSMRKRPGKDDDDDDDDHLPRRPNFHNRDRRGSATPDELEEWSLAQWLSKQRVYLDKGELASNKVKLLAKVGVHGKTCTPWSWDERYQQLLKYQEKQRKRKAKNSHREQGGGDYSLVPLTRKRTGEIRTQTQLEETRLAEWVSKQRAKVRNQTLELHRVQKLIRIGVVPGGKKVVK